MTQPEIRIKQDGEYLASVENGLNGYVEKGIEVLTYPLDGIGAVVLDLDDCLYQCQEWRVANLNGEATAIAYELGWLEVNDVEAARERIKQERKRVGEILGLGRAARNTETVIYLMGEKGKNESEARDWYDTTRVDIAKNLDPRAYIQNSPAVVSMIESILNSEKQIAIASNSPSGVVEMITEALGINDELRDQITLIGPDVVGTSKPNPEYYRRVAQKLALSPTQCLMVGDDMTNDGLPSIEAGMGAVIINSVDDVTRIVTEVIDQEAFSNIHLGDIAEQTLPNPGEVKVLGVTGRAGAGKSTSAAELANEYAARGIDAHVLSLDAFFILSSKERSAWLAGSDLPMIMDEDERLTEIKRREDQDTWWDFEQAAYWLDQLRSGNSIRVENIYNRKDSGEKTGVLEINLNPQERGTVIVFEGVGVSRLLDQLDHVLFVNTHSSVREGRLLHRDIERRLNILLAQENKTVDTVSPDELRQYRTKAEAAALERWGVTQRYEDKIFGEVRPIVNGKAIVVDNSSSDDDLTSLDKLRKLPSHIPVK